MGFVKILHDLAYIALVVLAFIVFVRLFLMKRELGEAKDRKGQPCPVVVASRIVRPDLYAGCALEWTPGKMKILFTDHDHNILGRDELIFS